MAKKSVFNHLLANDWTHFFLPIFTAATDEKYFNLRTYITSKKERKREKQCWYAGIIDSCLNCLKFRSYNRFKQEPLLTYLDLIREGVSTGAAGAWTRRSLGHNLLHPGILRPRALFYRTDCTHKSKSLMLAFLMVCI